MTDNKSRRILLVDDEPAIIDLPRSVLSGAGYTHVDSAQNCAGALAKARERAFELAILDVMLPDGDGFTLFQHLRELRAAPVLFLTARGEDADRLTGLGLGADDYVVKPFLPEELLLRVGAILRRYYRDETPLLHLAGSDVDFERAEVVRLDGTHMPLTAKEFKLLDVLTLNANRIFDKQKLIDAVWGMDEYIDENTVAVTVARLRDKLKQYSINNVVTVWGLGYKWQD